MVNQILQGEFGENPRLDGRMAEVIKAMHFAESTQIQGGVNIEISQ